MDAGKGKDAPKKRKLLGGDEARGREGGKPRGRAASSRPRMDAHASVRLGGRVHYTTEGGHRRTARLLNDELPRDHVTGNYIAPEHLAVCSQPKRCGCAYSALMRAGGGVCEECALDDWWAVVLRLRDEGGHDLYTGSDHVGTHKWGQSVKYTEYHGGQDVTQQMNADLRGYGMPGVGEVRNRKLGDMDRYSDRRLGVMDGAVIRIGDKGYSPN